MKQVAAVISQWSKNSHADVILGRILEPEAWGHKKPYQMQLKSLYVDQFPEGKLARAMAQKHGFTIHDEIRSAITCGGRQTAVDGVLVIGEHGSYPRNGREQKLYPRRRFLDEVAEAFRRGGRVAPVFSDKHLSYEPLAAQWIMQSYRHQQIPLMAGSSLPVGWRFPARGWPLGQPIKRAFVQGYSELDAYGFHTLETLQCQVERRRGGETGVASVQALASGLEMWEKADWPRDLWRPLRAIYEKRPQYRHLPGYRKTDEIWKIQYADCLVAHVGMFTSQGEVWGVSLEPPVGPVEPIVFELQGEHPYGHFGYLTRAIDHFMETGTLPYPVERTYLTTGILAAALQSRSEGGKVVETPFLSQVKYQPTDWLFATGDVGTPA